MDRSQTLAPAAAEPFDRAARRQQRGRADGTADFLRAAIAAELVDRVQALDRKFAQVLDIGRTGITGSDLTVALEPSPQMAIQPISVAGDEDRLPFAESSFDLIASAAALHGVNDLPGALIQARRALRPDGLFVAGFFGGTSLSELRADLLAAEVELTGRAAGRILPMVDTDMAAGLLQRAGFADPVAEVDMIMVRYDDMFAVLRDLRAMGEGNILHGRAPLRRDVLAHAARRFAARAQAGRIAVTVQVIYLTGWRR
ncbi:methyltransferase domain-containing protein [Polymorphobacter sp. PAMC 29334]|uniref:class I SAM-dependent methyltransferase n=1 Tax=Polymorphobacter sp. PAMC 29334 TaxID=2862331 RepID=UPI001C746F48|nr:methyltransferase domain-containing protein [Polymorphobacter sp. PAMC 29334]QYE35048.1 methyltransferase domain-containing protein [Polymorphobacter sp. PAMC 29334]